VDKTTLEFFKIAELGEIMSGTTAGTPGYWAVDQLIANNGTWEVMIPASIAPGSYVLRNGILALHSAYSEGGAQSYPQCMNLVISSAGTETPNGILGVDLYTEIDLSVLYNIYNDGPDTDYQIPGPPVFDSSI